MSRVTTPKPIAEKATPFQEDSSEDHWRNLRAPVTTTQAQDMTTCSHNKIVYQEKIIPPKLFSTRY